MMRRTVLARFEESNGAEKAIGALLDHGVESDDVSVVFDHEYLDRSNQTALGHSVRLRENVETGITTTTADDAAAGAEVGAGFGLGLGVLAAAATVFIPGVGLVLGGGALGTALAGVAGATAAGAIAGGLTGYLKDQGVGEDMIVRYHETLAASGALIAVTAPSGTVSESKVEGILAKYGGLDVASYASMDAATASGRGATR
ncbi:MAG: hypothetical protein M9921_10655 [Fimbriimonadaceae bacterium]|nr:hypothetical protein [Chthonomonadaceae bacterium]MCO5297306.1 hypothetical protein [Fimbriimonadaceae bacterium]